ncbi:MAG: ABC transporter permease [Bacteroidales bacterium]|nr:ABC transporter permease [Bacteroidales bacterium]
MEILNEIWSSLRRNKLRTVLTGFAVSWGLFMIIALLGAGNGLLNAMMNNSGDVLTNVIVVWPGYRSIPYDGMKEYSSMKLDIGDIDYTATRFSDVVEDVTARIVYSDTVSFGKESVSVTMSGIAPLTFKIQGQKLLAGRFLNELDLKEKRRTMVVYSNTAESLLGDDPEYTKLLGKYVNVSGHMYQVVGIIEKEESMGGESDVFIPITTMSAVRSGWTWFSNLSFSFHGLETDEDNDRFEDEYKRAMNARHRAAPEDKRTFYVHNTMSGNMQMKKAVKIMQLALWILGIFTLLSGIVGVSNIMLITVKERIQEFGVRKALGATPWAIMKLIVVESVLVTAVFGLLGMLMGLGANYLMDITIGHSPIDVGFTQIYMFKNPGVDMSIAFEAVILIAVAGTIAGLIPAVKASRVRPVEALRKD